MFAHPLNLFEQLGFFKFARFQNMDFDQEESDMQTRHDNERSQMEERQELERRQLGERRDQSRRP